MKDKIHKTSTVKRQNRSITPLETYRGMCWTTIRIVNTICRPTGHRKGPGFTPYTRSPPLPAPRRCLISSLFSPHQGDNGFFVPFISPNSRPPHKSRSVPQPQPTACSPRLQPGQFPKRRLMKRPLSPAIISFLICKKKPRGTPPHGFSIAADYSAALNMDSFSWWSLTLMTSPRDSMLINRDVPP